MTTIINANTSAGLTQTADTSGIVKLQSNGVTTNALAWVNTNMSSGASVVRASYNISSITYNTTGDFTINFATALSDANYVVTCCLGGGNFYAFRTYEDATPRTSSLFRFITVNAAFAVANPVQLNIAVFGN